MTSSSSTLSSSTPPSPLAPARASYPSTPMEASSSATASSTTSSSLSGLVGRRPLSRPPWSRHENVLTWDAYDFAQVRTFVEDMYASARGHPGTKKAAIVRGGRASLSARTSWCKERVSPSVRRYPGTWRWYTPRCEGGVYVLSRGRPGASLTPSSSMPSSSTPEKRLVVVSRGTGHGTELRRLLVCAILVPPRHPPLRSPQCPLPRHPPP